MLGLLLCLFACESKVVLGSNLCNFGCIKWHWEALCETVSCKVALRGVPDVSSKSVPTRGEMVKQ